MPHASLRLRTDVRLIHLTERNATKMLEWVSDPEVATNIGLSRKPSLDYTENWIRKASKDSLVLARGIDFRSVYVGNVVIDRIDPHLGTGRFSIYIGDRTARGMGVGLTAAYLILQIAFGQLSLHKVWLTVHAANTTAIQGYTRLGFNLEGILRDEFVLDNQRLPLIYMGLLESEFRQLRLKGESQKEHFPNSA